MSWADALSTAEQAAIWWIVPLAGGALIAWWKLRHFWRRHKPAIHAAAQRIFYPSDPK